MVVSASHQVYCASKRWPVILNEMNVLRMKLMRLIKKKFKIQEISLLLYAVCYRFNTCSEILVHFTKTIYWALNIFCQRWLQSKNIEKRIQGAVLPSESSITKASERFPITCTIACSFWYIILSHWWNSSLNPAVFKIVTKNRWSTLSKAWIDSNWSVSLWCALLSSLESHAPSANCLEIISHSKPSSVQFQSLITSCKWFAKTRAKIFNCV